MIEFPSEAIVRNKELDAAVLMDFQSVAGSVILLVAVSLGDSKPPGGGGTVGVCFTSQDVARHGSWEADQSLLLTARGAQRRC